MLLIVDEAQNLPIGSLEQLRMLSNFSAGAQPLSQTILLGQPEFRDKLSSASELEQLRQRVIASHHLEPMRRAELPDYVENRLAMCGWANDPTFTEDAYDALFDYSGGVPRKLNNLCARVLLFGALEEKHEIDAEVVKEVTDDLHKDNAPREREKVIPPNSASLSVVPSSPVQPVAPAATGIVADQQLLARLDSLERYAMDTDRSLRQALRMLSDLVEHSEVERAQYGVSRSA